MPEIAVQDSLLATIHACVRLRRLDLYRMGPAVTDQLCVDLMLLNLRWAHGCGLRWLRLDLRFGAASAETLAALVASSSCAHMELRTLPAEPSLTPRRTAGLQALPRLQALARARIARHNLLRQRRAIIALQAWTRSVASRQYCRQQGKAVVQLQAAVRGFLVRRRSTPPHTNVQTTSPHFPNMWELAFLDTLYHACARSETRVKPSTKCSTKGGGLRQRPFMDGSDRCFQMCADACACPNVCRRAVNMLGMCWQICD